MFTIRTSLLLAALAFPISLPAQDTGYIQRLGVMDGQGNMVYRYYNDKGQRINFNGSAFDSRIKPMSRGQLEGLVKQSQENLNKLGDTIKRYNDRNAQYSQYLNDYQNRLNELNKNRSALLEADRNANDLINRAENMNIIGSAGSGAWADSMNRRLDARRNARDYRQRVDTAMEQHNKNAKNVDEWKTWLENEREKLVQWQKDLNQSKSNLANEKKTLSDALSRTLSEKGLGDHGSGK